MDEGDVVEVLENRFIGVDLSDWGSSVDLGSEIESVKALEKSRNSQTYHVSIRETGMSDVVTDTSNHQGENVHRSQ